jgi:hypothetical protein
MGGAHLRPAGAINTAARFLSHKEAKTLRHGRDSPPKHPHNANAPVFVEPSGVRAL